MRTRCLAAAIAGIVGMTAPAYADPRAEVAAKARAAMASYDSMDYEAARKQLNQALAIARKAKLDRDPVVAQVYLDLGITQFAGSDHEAARVAFLSAVQIDPTITIDPAYRSPDLVKLLDEAKAAAAASVAPTSGATSESARVTEPTAGTVNDTEDPLDAGGTASAGVSDRGAPGRSSRVMIAISGGTGLGYVTGLTESDNRVETCCIGASPIVVSAELGYYATPRLSIGVAARAGFPIGANTDGHSTLAPAGFLRVRYALSSTGDGFRVMGEVGGGVLRNTIKLDNMESGGDTDIVAQGPLLIGAGIGYTRRLTGSLAFHVDLDAITGVAVVDKVGGAVRLNSGISADMSLGLAVGF